MIMYWIRRFIKWPIQRLFLGYCDRDLWSVDCSIAKYSAKLIQAFIDRQPAGCPGNFADECETYEEACDKWLHVLGKMVYSLEYISKNGSPYETEDEYDRVTEGYNLYVKYFFALWD